MELLLHHLHITFSCRAEHTTCKLHFTHFTVAGCYLSRWWASRGRGRWGACCARGRIWISMSNLAAKLRRRLSGMSAAPSARSSWLALSKCCCETWTPGRSSHRWAFLCCATLHAASETEYWLNVGRREFECQPQLVKPLSTKGEWRMNQRSAENTAMSIVSHRVWCDAWGEERHRATKVPVHLTCRTKRAVWSVLGLAKWRKDVLTKYFCGRVRSLHLLATLCFKRFGQTSSEILKTEPLRRLLSLVYGSQNGCTTKIWSEAIGRITMFRQCCGSVEVWNFYFLIVLMIAPRFTNKIN